MWSRQFLRGCCQTIGLGTLSRMVMAGGCLPARNCTTNISVRPTSERQQTPPCRAAFRSTGECRSPRVPLSSFHIEMLLHRKALPGVKSYARRALRRPCNLLLNGNAAPCGDPLGIAGHIRAVKTEAQRESSLASVRYSREHAKDGCLSDYAGNVNEAYANGT